MEDRYARQFDHRAAGDIAITRAVERTTDLPAGASGRWCGTADAVRFAPVCDAWRRPAFCACRGTETARDVCAGESC